MAREESHRYRQTQWYTIFCNISLVRFCAMSIIFSFNFKVALLRNALDGWMDR